MSDEQTSAPPIPGLANLLEKLASNAPPEDVICAQLQVIMEQGRDRERLTKELGRLARFITDEVPGAEPTAPAGAVDAAIRLIRDAFTDRLAAGVVGGARLAGALDMELARWRRVLAATTDERRRWRVEGRIDELDELRSGLAQAVPPAGAKAGLCSVLDVLGQERERWSAQFRVAHEPRARAVASAHLSEIEFLQTAVRGLIDAP